MLEKQGQEIGLSRQGFSFIWKEENLEERKDQTNVEALGTEILEVQQRHSGGYGACGNGSQNLEMGY